MRVRLRHEWLQKHPTPRHGGGDFHWFPGDVDADLRAALAEAVRGGGQALWRIDPGRVAWAVTFAEIAPADRRRYTGLAVTIAEVIEEPGASAAELLAAIRVQPATPWRDQDVREEIEVAPRSDLMAPPAAVDAVTAARAARALWQGGALTAPDPTARELPALLASLETWLPPAVRARPRAGTVVATDDGAPPGPLHHYLGLAWALPPEIAARDANYGRRAWRLALVLAERAGKPPEVVFDELAALAQAWDTARDLDAYLTRSGTVRADERAGCDRLAPAPLAAAADAGRLWNRVLHYWGRGFLAGVGLDDRLAALLARRVIADHLFHLDEPGQAGLPTRYLRRLRWEALLPSTRVQALEARIAAHVPEVLGG